MNYFIIFGGELFNKGAQAMTFITVDEIAKRFPNSKAILVSSQDYRRDKNEKDNYKFQIAKSPSLKQILKTLFRIPFLNKDKSSRELFGIMSNAVCFIDVSGYALGSNWGSKKSLRYLFRIALAKRFNVPIILFPQSFGPFTYNDLLGSVFMLLAKYYLPYVKIIMARENEGYKMLMETFKLKNVIKTDDMVLQNRGIDINNIYKQVPDFSKISIMKNSVAIIPNTKNNVYGDKSEILEIYCNTINELTNCNKNVYLIFHSAQDFDLCKEIKSHYCDNSNVVFIEEELSCFEYDDIIVNFDFIIASRFHAVVHAYKRNIPAIILGWSIKYKELAESVNQDKYCFDVRDSIDRRKFFLAVKKMCTNYQEESQIIDRNVKKIQRDNIFETFQKVIVE